MATVLAYTVLFWLVYSSTLFLLVLLEDTPHSAHRAVRPRRRRGSVPPLVSLLIPAHNEAHTLPATLSSVLSLTYPPDRLEIVVVDDGSTDGTAEVATSFQRMARGRITVIRQPNRGKYAALNAAVAHARGTYIATLDADSTVAPDALSHLVAALEAHPDAGAATAAMVVRNPTTLLQHLQSAEYAVAAALRRAYACLDAQYVTPGPLSLFRRRALRSVGLWKEAHLTEDLEMALRLQRAGWRILNVPEARVATTTPASFSALLRQRVRWTYGFLRNTMDYRDLLSPRYRHLGLFVLPNMLVGLFTALYGFGYLLVEMVRYVADRAAHWYYAGFPWRFDVFFEWFYLPLTPFTVLSIGALLLAFALLIVGRTLSGARPAARGTCAYLAFYSFIAPLWLCAALMRAIIGRPPRWRASSVA